MKFNRTKNASRNIFYGMILKLYQIIVPFVMRTAMIYLLGVQYLGLDSLFASILSVLNLAELGVGNAMVYSMYKPIANDDTKTICALMKMYKVYYRIIGTVVLVGGLILCPFMPRLISGTVPEGIDIYILFLMNLAATVISYWLFAYKNCLLQAHQRADVVSRVTMGVNTVRYSLQFLLLFIFHNYYYYLIVTLVSQAAINVTTSIVVDKMYPKLNPKGQLPQIVKDDINRRIRDLFTAKIGAVVVSSVDTLVISAFLGLTILAIYQNYYYIITAITGLINIIILSCMAGIGNSIVTENEEKNYKDLKTFTLIIVWIAGFCTSCLLNMFQPFMEIWTGKELMFEFPAIICFGIYFFIMQINTLLNVYKDAAGIWHEDRFRPLVTACVNLGLNLIMVRFCGIYGILLSTVLSMLFVGMPWLLHNLFTVLFKKQSLLQYIKRLILYIVTVTIACIASLGLGKLIMLQGMYLLIVRFIVSAIVTNITFFLIFKELPEFKKGMQLLNQVTRGKISVLRWLANKL